jgi:predicted DNA-binding transcriptional regulator AlpA
MTKASDRIIRLEAVLDRSGLSLSTVYRKIHEGPGPRNPFPGIR